MTASNATNLLQAAMAAIRGCADTMDERAAGLAESLTTAAIGERLRLSAIERCAGLRDASSRVTFELALLDAEVQEASADASDAVRRLSAMDATLLSAVAAMTEIVDQLESVAENDDRLEPVYVRVVEAVGAVLQVLEKAKAATQQFGTAASDQSRPRRSTTGHRPR